MLVKSSTKDLLRPIFEIAGHQPTTRLRHFVDTTYTVQAEAIDTRVIGRSFSFFGMDSDLEALSHNPTDQPSSALATTPLVVFRKVANIL